VSESTYCDETLQSMLTVQNKIGKGKQTGANIVRASKKSRTAISTGSGKAAGAVFTEPVSSNE